MGFAKFYLHKVNFLYFKLFTRAYFPILWPYLPSMHSADHLTPKSFYIWRETGMAKKLQTSQYPIRLE